MNGKITRYDSNPYEIKNGYIKIYTTDFLANITGDFIVDTEDYDKIKKHRWYKDSTGYIRTTINHEKIRLHRFLIPNVNNNLVIDHINNDKTDNRKSNLRIITHKQNTTRANSNQNPKSGYTGVYETPRNTWVSYIENNNKRYNKTFKTKQEAIIQRFIWELQFFGEFSPQIELIKSNYKPLLGYFQVKDKMKFTDDIELIKNICDELNINPHCPCMLNKTSDTTICPCLPCRNIQKCCCGLYVPINNKKEE